MQWQEEVVRCFRDDLREAMEKKLEIPRIEGVTGEARFVPAVSLALEETCQAWAKRVDQNLFPGQPNSGIFLFLCPTYGLSPDDFQALTNSIYRQDTIKRFLAFRPLEKYFIFHK